MHVFVVYCHPSEQSLTREVKNDVRPKNEKHAFLCL